jgi:hypothetical protein
LLALFIPVSTFTTPAATGAWATWAVADAMPAMKQPLMRGEDVAFGADGTPRGETVACVTRLPGRLRRRREHLWTASTAAHCSHVDDQCASPAAGLRGLVQAVLFDASGYAASERRTAPSSC